ncbi:redoxin domain-containing protein [Mucilaginibacter sp. BJC16-A38]|uniref:redoxin domain-containing protein n=1 Tax=Mucilaginibacter phenanthrenivorans TaxID=1234842 RepID=UPI0021571C49|nr:redoxin domain-containing protein [Mucilaginibacter phenanthrenivorans]MCR8559236.1 redoxin domain-containing protein [Mucilaginibacter phenanthrenivorans]
MIKSNLKRPVYLILLLIACSAGPALAQIPVRTGPAPAEEIKKARLALDTNMNSMAAHKKYIYAMGINTTQVVDQYREWMKKYPENETIPLSIGTVYYNAEMPQAGEFLLRASAMEPGNAKIWSMLSGDAFTRGQMDLAIEYKKKATLADPSNADYAVSYLFSFSGGDPAAYKQKVFDFVKRFPQNEAGAYALCQLGEQATNRADKITYFEELRKLYPPQKFNWSASGMIELVDIYLQTDPGRALALINEMGGEKPWPARKQVAEALIRVNKLEQGQNYKDALTELNQVKLPRYNFIKDYIAIKKAALREQSGDVKAAYDSLAVRFAKLPTEELYAPLALYGSKLGKDKEQVAKDIETTRNSTAVAAYPFDLGLYTSTGNLSLKDLKGKVVLLTFWFPNCSPCRAEFPHFEAVLNKFKGDDVVYVGIDVSPLQDGFVLPLMKNNKYSFIPLRGNAEFAAKNYGVQGEPENFLIDKDGKIVFSNFRIDGSNHRTLELMISSLLKKGQQSN